MKNYRKFIAGFLAVFMSLSSTAVTVMADELEENSEITIIEEPEEFPCEEESEDVEEIDVVGEDEEPSDEVSEDTTEVVLEESSDEEQVSDDETLDEISVEISDKISNETSNEMSNEMSDEGLSNIELHDIADAIKENAQTDVEEGNDFDKSEIIVFDEIEELKRQNRKDN